jgi:hypothetical protein
MSQHGTDPILQVGYLRSCMDRRFVQATRSTFEDVTGLTNDQYYHEAFAGGVLNTAFPVEFPTNSPPTPDGADYVYNNPDIPLEVMGWQAHLDHCGGLKGVPDPELRDRFLKLVNSEVLQRKYPRVRHVFLLAYEDSNHQPIVEIIEPTRAKL